MTVSTLTNRVIYLGNGSATSFAVPFKVLDEDHLVVQRRLLSANEIDHTYVGTDYSYSGIGADSGTLTLSGAALSSSYQLEIERIVPYTQPLDIVNAGGFYPETVEEQLDLTTMQVQQIATQSDDIETRALMVPVGTTAPSYADFAAAFQGDPGGNVESVGLFTTLAAGLTAIPAGTDVVRSSGYAAVGVGDAVYARHADVDAAYVAANPLTSFMSVGVAANLGFRLISSWVTPWIFGAVGDYSTDRVFSGDVSTWGVVDNRAAAQALIDYVEAQDRKVVGDLRGNWGILDHDADGIGLIINQPRDNGQIYIGGTFIAMEAMDTMIYVTNFRNSQMWGTLGLLGTDVSGNMEERAPYADRLAKDGLVIENANRSIFHEVKTGNTLRHGIRDNPDGPGNNIHLTIQKIFGSANGSWPFWAAQFAPAKTFTTRVDAGDDGNPNQTSVLSGISSTADFEVESFAWSTALEKRFYIKSKTATSLTVYPWPDHSLTSGELIPMHGSALSLTNNDNTGFIVHQLDAFYAGSAAATLSGLYGPQVLDLQAQFCSAPFVVGQAKQTGSDICRGVLINRLHDEANEQGIIQVSSNSWWSVGQVAVLGQEADVSLFERIVVMRPRFAATTLAGIENYQYGLSGHIRVGGTSYSGKGFWTDGRIEAFTTYTNSADGRPYHLHIPAATNHTIKLHCDEHINSKFYGCHVAHFIVTGTGTAGQPTGSITVEPTAAQTTAGYTVNGGASVVLSSLPQFAHIICSREAGSLNWIISWSGRNQLKGSATYDPPSLALAASGTIQTMTITGLALGDVCVGASFSLDLAGAEINAWCSATNTASFFFTNKNGTNPLDLASGTVRLLFQRST